MSSQQILKLVSSLHQKKFRESEKLFAAEGYKVVTEALRSVYSIRQLYLTHKFAESNEWKNLLIEFPRTPYEIISSREMEKISVQSTPEGIVAIIHFPEQQIDFKDAKHILYLDSINDPGNLGTLLRSALWFGINHVLLSPGTADLYNPKTVRSAMGALFHLNCVAEFSDNALKLLISQNYQLYAAEMNGRDYRTLQPESNFILAIGNEHHGLRKEILELTDTFVRIPGAGKMESLNAAVAGSILMAHFAERR